MRRPSFLPVPGCVPQGVGSTIIVLISRTYHWGRKNIEILSLVLYTGPLFVLYRGLPRGFGDCGSVQHILDFWSTDGKFEKQLKRRTVNNRMTGAGHKFSSKNHCLVRAVKKLQRLTSGVQGTWLCQGLGGLDIHAFREANSFTEKEILKFEG